MGANCLSLEMLGYLQFGRIVNRTNPSSEDDDAPVTNFDADIFQHSQEEADVDEDAEFEAMLSYAHWHLEENVDYRPAAAVEVSDECEEGEDELPTPTRPTRHHVETPTRASRRDMATNKARYSAMTNPKPSAAAGSARQQEVDITNPQPGTSTGGQTGSRKVM